MKILDCFCGLGGASEGFHSEGFECIGIDIVNVGYPYKFILGDMLKLKGEDFRGYDVIWGSPPCRDFSQMAHVGYGSKRDDCKGKWAWKNPPNPQKGLELVKAYLVFVEDAKPKIWIMENVPGLIKYLPYIPPRQISKITETKKRAFWGNYPDFLMPTEKALNVAKSVKGRVYCVQGKYRSWQRAKIPFSCSQAFAKACKESLTDYTMMAGGTMPKRGAR